MDRLGLYIHIPFCEKKCYYCDFASYSGKRALVVPYLNALAKEIEAKTRGRCFDTIFIGGGTPSYLSSEELVILSGILSGVSRTEECEFTMECNPGNITKEKAKVLWGMGVNRISIGLQSSNDTLLMDIGRIHTFREFRDNFLMLREAGFKNINVDIIYGLPGETLEIFGKTLDDVAMLEPEHISCYSLIIEENTQFYVRRRRDTLILPDEDTEDAMKDLVTSRLESLGFLRYEISNYAREGFECRHNRNYWEFGEYIGCGAAAHEFTGGLRRENIRTVEGYIRSIESDSDAAVRVHENSREDSIEEFLFMGMRLVEGISLNSFKSRFSEDIMDIFGDVIRRHMGDGLLVIEGDRMRFTEKGMDLSNHVLSDLILTV
ncbi:radical SAM family heme chaperone HemW [Youngiibacter fragilis]|uniref:radical SAM family heme chaperone HemW n=1 Tax=Youngiibacter fragilis TaxID=1408819 RepID=UPI000402F9F6|nr:radical SAM family heme chaperone HemW [Youngiibacter fragilis]